MAEHLPQLSIEDGALIAEYFACDRCYFVLSQQASIPLHALLDWAAQPHIQRAIDLISQSKLEGQRAAAIEALGQSLRISQDPVERRRTACAIIRAVCARPTRLQPARSGDDPWSSPRRAPAHRECSTPCEYTPPPEIEAGADAGAEPHPDTQGQQLAAGSSSEILPDLLIDPFPESAVGIRRIMALAGAGESRDSP